MPKRERRRFINYTKDGFAERLPLTGDLGARVDFQNIPDGQTLRLAKMELVPVMPADALNLNDLLLNTSPVTLQVACPLAASHPELCAGYVKLVDNQPVTWPTLLSPRSSEIVYLRNPQLIDSDGDGDGIPDSQDRCANTPVGAGVNSAGCAVGQL